jgi:prevent-host-death family protein
VQPRMIPMREAKERLPGLVREAACGARLTITVHGRPLADLVPHLEIQEAPPPPPPPPRPGERGPGPRPG